MAVGSIITGTKEPQPRVFTQADAAKFLQRGFQAMMQRDFREASGCAQLVLKHFPKAREGHFLVGLIGVESGDWKTAETAFKNVVGLDETHVAAWAQLARAFLTTGQYSNAETALKRAVTLGSDDPLVQEVIGTVYSLLGHQEEALGWHDRAKAKSGSAYFDISRAKSLTFLGRLDEARTALENVLAARSNSAQAHWMLARLGKAKDGAHAAAMQAELDKLPEGHPDRPFFAYAIGKELEDLERYDEAFEAYRLGAKSRRAAVQYDETAEQAMFDMLRKTYTPEWLASAAPGEGDPSPIFIVGQPRTGTTLVERIITAHSQVHSAGELQQFGMALKRMTGVNTPRQMTDEILAKAADIDPLTLGQLYLATTRAVRGDLPRFVDKLPVNYLYLPLMAAALPNARFIHMTRGAADSCFASYKQLFAEAYFHSYDQEEMARHYVRYRTLMDRWQDLLGDRLLTVAYEDVVSDVQGMAPRIISYLGLEWEDACADFHKNTGAVTTASAVQVREKAHTRSVGKWKRFEKQLGPMLSVLKGAGLHMEP